MDLLHTIFFTIVTLGILVTIHEWGHFFVARRCGVKVLRFSVGFGKAFYTWRDKQGTEFAVAAIPLGGYVKMLDEREAEVPAEQHHLTFNRKPVLQRIAIVAAGPLVNLIFAFLAYWVMSVVGVSTVAPIIGQVAEQSYAAQAGVPVKSEIIAIDGHEVKDWNQVNLRLASRVGESGEVRLRLQEPDSTLQQDYVIRLDDWRFDVEKESPVFALGLTPWRPVPEAVLDYVVDDSPAAVAGLQAGDRIVQLQGRLIENWYQLVAEVKANPEKPLLLGVQRDGETLSMTVIPQAKTDDQGQTHGYMGAAAQAVDWPEEYKRTLRYDVIDAVIVAFKDTVQMIVLILDSIWKMIEGAISVKNLSGPITIANVASASAESGLETYISFLAYLSISLGILNLLPIPVLDGGHLLYYTIELIRGKPVSERVQVFGLKIGMVLLFSVMFVAIFNDIARLW